VKVTNKLMPSEKQEELLNELGSIVPVFMINLVRFRDKAIYEDGRDTNLSGKEAYGLYGQAVIQMLPKYNAEVVLSTHITELIIGEVEELWDEISVVQYASRKELNDMVTSQEWNEINIHRIAGIKGQLNIESVRPS
jgi:hypothetical protein